LVNEYLGEKLIGRTLTEFRLSYYQLLQVSSYFSHRILEKYVYVDEDFKLNLNRYKIDPFVNELINEMKSYSRYLKSFEVFDLFKDGYYILPLRRIL
jgi:hypothetical protein